MLPIKEGDKVLLVMGEIIEHGIAKKVYDDSVDVYMLEGIYENKTVNFENFYIEKDI